MEKYKDPNLSFQERAEDLADKMTFEEQVPQLSYGAPAIDRLGVPAYNWWNEGLHGVARAGTATMFPQAIGLAAMFDDKLLGKNEVGVATGLAWTIVGGETLFIETAVLDGGGKLSLTGQLGDVMQESARAGISYIRANAKKLKISEDFYKDKDIHIHIPEGAVPKDGPSAGVTMCISVISAHARSYPPLPHR